MAGWDAAVPPCELDGRSLRQRGLSQDEVVVVVVVFVLGFVPEAVFRNASALDISMVGGGGFFWIVCNPFLS